MKRIAIRSDKDIQIQFRVISLPEFTDGLYPLIKAIGDPDIAHTLGGFWPWSSRKTLL
jgi:hypothetical protein